jgi:hypothetical protein
MSPENINQQDPDQIYEIVPEANQETIDSFLASLEGEFDYPAFTHLSSTQTDEEIASEIVEEEETPDEVDDEVPPPTPPPAPPVQDPPVTAPDTVLVNGNPVPLADIQRLYEFDQYLRQNPDAAERVQQAVTVREPAVPTPAAAAPPANEVTPPDFLDMDDPAHKFMWESHLAQQQQLQQFTQQNIQREQEALNQKAMAEMDTALSRFRSAHPNLNDDQIIQIRKHGAEMNIASAVMATTVNPVDGFVRILDLAALDTPDIRSTYLDTEVKKTPTTRQRSTERKGKLNALGGSSGSVPRTTTTPRPVTDREAIDQFAQGLAESLGQN